MSNSAVLAFDLGSSGGRAIKGTFNGDRLTLSEVHRFSYGSSQDPSQNGALAWDIDLILQGIYDSLNIVQHDTDLESVGIDSWGVDYALLDERGNLLRRPRCYRDARMVEAKPLLDRQFSPWEQWQATGVQPQEINTSVQVFADLLEEPELTKKVSYMQLIPDYIAQCLGAPLSWGRAIVSSSGLASPGARQWSDPMMNAVGIPRGWLGNIEQDAQIAGITDNGIRIVRPGGHDTACAFHCLGISQKKRQIVISCGSWSLVGITSPEVLLTREVYDAGFTNEVRTDGGIRLLRNLTGLWLLQECQKYWKSIGEVNDISSVIQAATSATSLDYVIDPSKERFMRPCTMPREISEECEMLYGVVPSDVGQMVLLIIESLAVAHAKTIQLLEQFTELNSTESSTVYFVGGGAQNALLAQATADASGKVVIAGPVEASAFGNIFAQFEALEIMKKEQLAHVLERSCARVTYYPNLDNHRRMQEMQNRLDSIQSL